MPKDHCMDECDGVSTGGSSVGEQPERDHWRGEKMTVSYVFFKESEADKANAAADQRRKNACR
jgi:hypothetical protein